MDWVTPVLRVTCGLRWLDMLAQELFEGFQKAGLGCGQFGLYGCGERTRDVFPFRQVLLSGDRFDGVPQFFRNSRAQWNYLRLHP
jgi:hypothetical protein